MLRHVAPAGAPIAAGDLLRGLARLATGRDARTDLRRQVAKQFGVEYCELTSTGRAGLTLILRALGRLSSSGRDEVILPSYTCYSVAASIVKAGFKPRVVDVDPRTLDVDHAQLESMPLDRVLAIVATGLYGMPGDLPRLERFARDRGVFLVDDAAQAMGARVGGRLCGTFGDAGLFSLDKGKNVSAIDGGVLVTSSAPVAAALAEETTRLALPSFGHEAAWYVKLMAYAALLHPRLYWMPNSVPQLQLGKTVYTTEYPMALPGGAAAALGTAVLPRLAALNARRRDNARCLLAELEGISGIQTVEPVPDGEPVYLRLPVLVRDSASRDRLVVALNARGIGATGSYPRSIIDIPELATMLVNGSGQRWRGRDVAARILTLPTHPYVQPRDVSATSAIIRASLTDDVALSVGDMAVH